MFLHNVNYIHAINKNGNTFFCQTATISYSQVKTSAKNIAVACIRQAVKKKKSYYI